MVCVLCVCVSVCVVLMCDVYVWCVGVTGCVCVFVLYIVVRSEKRRWEGGDSWYSSPTQTGYGMVAVMPSEHKGVGTGESQRIPHHYATIITTPPSSLHHHHYPLTVSHSLSCYLLCIVSIG